MIFDQPPAELPVATLRSREVGSQLAIDIRQWLAARWRWLRPRTIPVAVAGAGMIAVIASANYLRDFTPPEPERVDAPMFVRDVTPVEAMAPIPPPTPPIEIKTTGKCGGVRP